LLIAGFAVTTVGVAGLGLSGSWTGGLVSVFAYGAGLGLTIPTANLFVARVNKQRGAAALNILNFAWSAGAVVCPLLVTSFVRDGSLKIPLFVLSTLLASIALMLRVCRCKEDDYESARTRHTTPRVDEHKRTQMLVVFIAAFVFLYVGTENGIGGWVASYAKRLDDSPGSMWAWSSSVFWFALLFGRALAPLFLRLLETEKLVLTGLVVAGFGIFVLLATKNMTILIAGIFIAGFGLAPVFPSTIALLPHYFGDLATRITGYIFALASLGGATLPYLIGFVSHRSSSLHIGLFVVALSCCLMILIQLATIVLRVRTAR
jgi:fucose permease